MSKALLPWISVAILAIIAFFVMFPSNTNAPSISTTTSNNVVVKNGIQYVMVDVGRGYQPKTSTIQG